jgi:elongation factor P
VISNGILSFIRLQLQFCVLKYKIVIEATSLKAGTTFLLDRKPYRVVKYAHQKIARGGGTVKLSLRNLKNGRLEDKTLSSSSKLEEIATSKKPLQYLYSDGTTATFMIPKTFEQYEIDYLLIKDQLVFVKEGETINVLFWDDKPLSINVPTKVSLAVKDTPPGVKGNTSSNIYKPAVLENDLIIKVPLFIKAGDKIRVDTRTGEYVERVR